MFVWFQIKVFYWDPLVSHQPQVEMCFVVKTVQCQCKKKTFLFMGVFVNECVCVFVQVQIWIHCVNCANCKHGVFSLRFPEGKRWEGKETARSGELLLKQKKSENERRCMNEERKDDDRWKTKVLFSSQSWEDESDITKKIYSKNQEWR